MEKNDMRNFIPQHPDILEKLVTAMRFKPKKRRQGRSSNLLDADDVIDLGGPYIPPNYSGFDFSGLLRPRRRFGYVPNPRLYPGPPVKRTEVRVLPERKRRRGKRILLGPLPNSRLYRPQPALPACPPPPLTLRPLFGTLETASRVALRVGERRQQAPPAAAPAPAGRPPAAPHSRQLVVTLPAAVSPPSLPPRYIPASAHFRLNSAPQCIMEAARGHSASLEDCSDEPLSAPSEFLAEFLSAIMRQQYAEALKYCRLILQYEPHNTTAKGFYPLLQLKLQKHHPAGGEQWSSSEESINEEGSPDELMALAADESRAGSAASQSSLELDSEPARTDSDPAVSTGFWETSSSGERSAADDNGNAPPPSLHLREEDLENDNASAKELTRTQEKKSESPTLSRLRAQFACFIK